MRTALAATAITALALFTAAPTALAGEHGGGDRRATGTDHARQAERLMRAADRFDAKAAGMRARSGRLRATALELRQEAEELAGDGFAPDPAGDTAKAARESATDDQPIEGPEDGHEADGEEACAWDGEDDLGFSREHDPFPATEEDEDGGSEDGGEDAEICHLLHLADRLEQRADALDVAAGRMEFHATRLREQASKLLAKGGKRDAERLLATAAKLRTAALELRAHADTLRDTAFHGAEVDEETIDRVRRLELRAAAFDTRANRLEARAAKLAA